MIWVPTQVFEKSESRRGDLSKGESPFAFAFETSPVPFPSEGITVIQTPVRAPKANAYAERFVRTVRNECLDWLLILGRRHLEHTLRVFVEHYNAQRPHRGLQLRTPVPVTRPALASANQIQRTDLLGGLIHEYTEVA